MSQDENSNRDKKLPKLQELSPSSVVRIFQFIEELVEKNNLDLHFFNSREKLFNSEELYFLDFYIESYLSSLEPESYFNKWLKKQEQYLDTPELFDSFAEYMTTLQQNLLQIKHIVDLNTSIRFSDNKSIRNAATDDTLLVPISFKILLMGRSSKVYDFRQYVIEKLQPFLSEEQSILFFNNSFSTSAFYFPPNLLDLKVVDKSGLGTAMLEIWKRYKSKLFDKHLSERKRESHLYELEDDLKDLDIEVRKIAITQYAFSLYFNLDQRDFRKAKKSDFMKILYNSFPHIRAGYLKAKKRNHLIQIEDYLKQRASSTIR